MFNQLHYPLKMPTFFPRKTAVEIAGEFGRLQAQHNKTRSTLSGATRIQTFGAQTGRGSEKGCLIRRTLDPKYGELIRLVHSLAASAENVLPYLGLQVLMLEAGQELNKHQDYHSHLDLPKLSALEN